MVGGARAKVKDRLFVRGAAGPVDPRLGGPFDRPLQGAAGERGVRFAAERAGFAAAERAFAAEHDPAVGCGVAPGRVDDRARACRVVEAELRGRSVRRDLVLVAFIRLGAARDDRPREHAQQRECSQRECSRQRAATIPRTPTSQQHARSLLRYSDSSQVARTGR